MTCNIHDDLKNLILDFTYPIGSTILRYDTVNPSTLFGGTWVKLPAGYYLLTASSSPGETGGSLTSGGTAITLAQMAAHVHWFNKDTNVTGNHNHQLVSNQNNTAGATSYPHLTGGYGTQRSDWEAGFSSILANGDHSHNVQGDTDSRGGNQAHTHTIDPNRIKVIAWRRTA